MAITRTALSGILLALGSALAAAQDAPAVRVRAVAFSPDGSRLAASTGEAKGPGRVMVWDAAGRMVRQLDLDTGVPSVSFSADGSRLALAGYDGQARILELAEGKVTQELHHPKGVVAVAFAPDGRLATAAGDNVVRVWNVAAGKELFRTATLKLPVTAVTFSPDGKRLAGCDRRQAFVWDARTGQLERTLGEPFDSTPGAGFAEGGRFLVRCYGNDGSMEVHDSATGRLHVRTDRGGGISYVGFSQGGGVAVTSYSFERTQLTVHRLQLGEPSAGERSRIEELLRELDADDAAVRERATERLAAMGLLAEPFLKRAMTESPSAEVRLRSRKAREKLLSTSAGQVHVPEGDVRGLAVSPDGGTVAVAGTDGAVRLMDLATGKLVGTRWFAEGK